PVAFFFISETLSDNALNADILSAIPRFGGQCPCQGCVVFALPTRKAIKNERVTSREATLAGRKVDYSRIGQND
ncbi:MAG TPA: hypothetical protein VFV34_22970, partial [Blastocatellia bacterium]|nr:hypothetical protein [Blastocatellia bacterium]